MDAGHVRRRCCRRWHPGQRRRRPGRSQTTVCVVYVCMCACVCMGVLCARVRARVCVCCMHVPPVKRPPSLFAFDLDRSTVQQACLHDCACDLTPRARRTNVAALHTQLRRYSAPGGRRCPTHRPGDHDTPPALGAPVGAGAPQMYAARAGRFPVHVRAAEAAGGCSLVAPPAISGAAGSSGLQR